MLRADIAAFLPSRDASPVEWVVSPGLVDYPDALEIMDRRVAAIASDGASECIWLLQHPSIYTAGTSAGTAEPAEARFPTYRTGRGGQYTYHGPGQRIVYAMLDLTHRRQDLRAFMAALEDWIISALADLGVCGERREGRVGVWVSTRRESGAEDKIAAFGIRVRRWVSFHGVALNVAPDLSHFSGIVPCGISDRRFGVTSLAKLGVPAELAKVDQALRHAFEPIFGPTIAADVATLDGGRVQGRTQSDESHPP